VKLPDLLFGVATADHQAEAYDYVGLDYYWGIDSFELDRIHQLIDASMSHYDHAPVDPQGLSRVLARFHRWFPSCLTAMSI
jgi:hypothetical protein